LHGLHPLLPFDLFEATFLVEGFKSGISTSDLLALHIRQLQKHESDIQRASQILLNARLRSKEQFNRRYAKKLQKDNYKKGELVLVYNSRLESTLNKFKVDPRYLGPFEVERRTSRGNYVLKNLDGTIHAEPYAAFRLYSYINRNNPILYKEIENFPLEEENEEEIQLSNLSSENGD